MPQDINDDDVTVVTAFFDIGNFSKRVSHRRNRDTYFEWMKKFRYIDNNVVFFADSEEVIKQMTQVRKMCLERTKIIRVNRSEMWPFKNFEKIQHIFRSSVYTNFTPIYPIYICVTHAKYYVMKIATEQDFFHTKYIMWLDIGYFRKYRSLRNFYLAKPTGFDDTKIAMTQVFPNKTFDVSPRKILQSKNVIASGATFFGERFQMMKFVTGFKRAVDYFMKLNLANTDEQVIYAMFSKEAKRFLKPEVQLQLYKANTERNWLYIGYTMMKYISNETFLVKS